MALSRVKNWIAGEVLTASDLNTEFNNILNNPGSLITPIGFNLTFTDATYDIGASGATRPRHLYLSGTARAGGSYIAGDSNGLARFGPETPVTIANNGTATIGTNARGGVLSVYDSGGAVAIYILRGTANDTTEVSDASNAYSKTKDNASTTNIYYESDNYIIQNKTGGSLQYQLAFLGC